MLLLQLVLFDELGDTPVSPRERKTTAQGKIAPKDLAIQILRADDDVLTNGVHMKATAFLVNEFHSIVLRPSCRMPKGVSLPEAVTQVVNHTTC